jgi:hypothetical protein
MPDVPYKLPAVTANAKAQGIKNVSGGTPDPALAGVTREWRQQVPEFQDQLGPHEIEQYIQSKRIQHGDKRGKLRVRGNADDQDRCRQKERATAPARICPVQPFHDFLPSNHLGIVGAIFLECRGGGFYFGTSSNP